MLFLSVSYYDLKLTLDVTDDIHQIIQIHCSVTCKLREDDSMFLRFLEVILHYLLKL